MKFIIYQDSKRFLVIVSILYHPLQLLRLLTNLLLKYCRHIFVSFFLPLPTQIADVKKFLGSKVKKIPTPVPLTESEVLEYLWNSRRNRSAEKKIVKFVEALWRLLFYSYFCFVGYKALFVPTTVVWIINTKEHWKDWPLQPVTDAVSFYYQVELGAYLHQLMWTEVARSDSVEMLIHHIATILLILGSYLTNFTRIGASILLLHDISDVFLESAKIFVYISKSKGGKWACNFCDCLFVLFAVSFFITRLVVYPRYLVYSLLYEAPMAIGYWPGFPLFAGLLLVLQCLHIFWFHLILRMIPSLLSSGIQKDERSDDEAEIEGLTYEKKDEGLERERERERDKHDTNEKFPALVDKELLTAKKIVKYRKEGKERS